MTGATTPHQHIAAPAGAGTEAVSKQTGEALTASAAAISAAAAAGSKHVAAMTEEERAALDAAAESGAGNDPAAMARIETAAAATWIIAMAGTIDWSVWFWIVLHMLPGFWRSHEPVTAHTRNLWRDLLQQHVWRLLPCPQCSGHFRQHAARLTPEDLASRGSLFRWMWRIHNNTRSEQGLAPLPMSAALQQLSRTPLAAAAVRPVLEGNPTALRAAAARYMSDRLVRNAAGRAAAPDAAAAARMNSAGQEELFSRTALAHMLRGSAWEGKLDAVVGGPSAAASAANAQYDRVAAAARAEAAAKGATPAQQEAAITSAMLQERFAEATAPSSELVEAEAAALAAAGASADGAAAKASTEAQVQALVAGQVASETQTGGGGALAWGATVLLGVGCVVLVLVGIVAVLVLVRTRLGSSSGSSSGSGGSGASAAAMAAGGWGGWGHPPPSR